MKVSSEEIGERKILKAKKALSTDSDSDKENRASNNTSLFRTSTQQDDAEEPNERTFMASPIALPKKKPVLFNTSSSGVTNP